MIYKKADDGNRTRLSTLGRSHSTDELHLLKSILKIILLIECDVKLIFLKVICTLREGRKEINTLYERLHYKFCAYGRNNGKDIQKNF